LVALKRSNIGERGLKEGSEEGEYGSCASYTRMNIEFLYLVK
jgi:hypothetical protein